MQDTQPSCRLSRATVGVVALAWVVRALIAAKPTLHLDNLFVPDDAYYTLAIARSLARGGPPAVDGHTLTNGFQPLLAFLEVPLLWLSGDDRFQPLRLTLWLTATADAVAAGLLAALGQQLAPKRGWWAGLLWAVAPVALSNAFSGLETSIAVALQLAILLAIARWFSPDAPPAGRVLSHGVVLGMLCGLALLARVDSVFLVLSVGLWLWQQRGLRTAGLVGACAAAVVAPWWGWCIVRLGSPIPESGAAVRAIVQIQHLSRSTLSTSSIVGRAAGTLLPAPMIDGTDLRDLLHQHRVLAWMAAAVWIGGVVAGIRWAWLRGAGWLRPLTLHFVSIVLLYVFWLPAVWFYPRYFEPLLAAQALALGVSLARWEPPEALRRIPVLVISMLSVAGSMQAALYVVARPHTSLDHALHGAKGYARPTQQILSHVPDGAVIGALQSGALAWFADRSVHVVNMDGVVDRGAAAAYRDTHLLQFARSRGVEYFADWPFNLRFIQHHDRAGSLPDAALSPVLRASPQGPRDAFVLLRIDWTRWPPRPEPRH